MPTRTSSAPPDEHAGELMKAQGFKPTKTHHYMSSVRILAMFFVSSDINNVLR